MVRFLSRNQGVPNSNLSIKISGLAIIKVFNFFLFTPLHILNKKIQAPGT